MQRSCFNRNRVASALAALLRLAADANTGRGAPAPKPNPPKPLPEYIVTAWKEAGAKVGWLRYYTFGFLAFVGEKEGQNDNQGRSKISEDRVSNGVRVMKQHIPQKASAMMRHRGQRIRI